MWTVLGALAPVLAKLIFMLMEKKKVDKENKKKFLEAIQSINGLRSTNLKKAFDKLDNEIEDYVDEYNAKKDL